MSANVRHDQQTKQRKKEKIGNDDLLSRISK